MADKWIQLMSEDGTDNLFPTTKMDLLWTNASPTSSFSAQTVSLDLSDYNVFLLRCRTATTQTNCFISVCVKGNNVLNGSYPFITQADNVSRIVDIDNSGFVFGAGRAGTNTSVNGDIIPYQIYGIK